jgi:single-strand DNA-binding protein
MELEVDDVGPALRYATAKVTRTPRTDGGNFGGGGGQPGRGPAGGAGEAFGDDPWAAAPGAGWGASAGGDEPPF